MRWIPSFVFGSDPDARTTLTLTRPLRVFLVSSAGIGGADVAASGIGEAIEIRRDRIAKIRIQFWESEQDDVEDMFVWAQRTLQPFDIAFDKDVEETTRTVRLFKPILGDGDFEPERGEFRGTLEFEFCVCTADGAKFGLNWSGQ